MENLSAAMSEIDLASRIGVQAESLSLIPGSPKTVTS